MVDINYRFVASIDFGTSGTAVAYSFNDPNNVSIEVCEIGSAVDQKARTEILVDDATKKVIEFGEQAFSEWEEGTTSLFQTFKMQLYKNPPPSQVKPDLGKLNLKTEELFGKALEEVVKRACKFICEHNNLESLSPREVKWILTVPAIWRPECKTMMRNAAVMAGMIDNRLSSGLRLGLEPECAAYYCQEKYPLLLKEGTKYLVLDCGGGTVDTAAFQVRGRGPNIKMQSLHEPSGNNFGGEQVDKTFWHFLRTLAGDRNIDRLTQAEKAEISQGFRDAKIRFTARAGAWINLRISGVSKWDRPLEYFVKEYNNRPDGGIKPVGTTSIKIPSRIMASFLKPSIDAITSHLETLMRAIPGLNYILLVGGFANSVALREKVKEKIEQLKDLGVQAPELRLIMPSRPQLTVVSGAVRFGMKESAIETRVVHQSYGVECEYTLEEFRMKFPDADDEIRKRHMVRESGNVGGIFWPLLSKGTSVSVTDPCTVELAVAYPGQEYGTVRVFCIDEKVSPSDLRYVSSENMVFEKDVEMRGSAVQVKLDFAATEILLSVVEKRSGRELQEPIPIEIVKRQDPQRNSLGSDVKSFDTEPGLRQGAIMAVIDDDE